MSQSSSSATGELQSVVEKRTKLVKPIVFNTWKQEHGVWFTEDTLKQLDENLLKVDLNTLVQIEFPDVTDTLSLYTTFFHEHCRAKTGIREVEVRNRIYNNLCYLCKVVLEMCVLVIRSKDKDAKRIMPRHIEAVMPGVTGMLGAMKLIIPEPKKRGAAPGKRAAKRVKVNEVNVEETGSPPASE